MTENGDSHRLGSPLPAVPPFPPPGTFLENVTLGQRIASLLLNPWRNRLLPQSLLDSIARRTMSPLIRESRLRPGGWRSMELIYDNAPPVDHWDKLALRVNPMSMALRNRRKYVTFQLQQLLARNAETGPVTVLGVGAGPGHHVQDAIIASQLPPSQVRAYLLDLDSDGLLAGQANARALGLQEVVHVIPGDARQVATLLPHISPHIVKLVGLIEYLTDDDVRELFAALFAVMPPRASLLTHGLVDAHGTAPFLRRMFSFHLTWRSREQVQELLRDAGFQIENCFVEPLGVYPMITAGKR